MLKQCSEWGLIRIRIIIIKKEREKEREKEKGKGKGKEERREVVRVLITERYRRRGGKWLITTVS